MAWTYDIVLWLAIGGFAGWIGSKWVGTDKDQDLLLNVLVGTTGAVLGGLLANVLTKNQAAADGMFLTGLIAFLSALILMGAMRGVRHVLEKARRRMSWPM